MRAMAEIGQHINKLYYRNKITLTTSVKENKPKNCEKRYERREVVLKEKEDWIKPTKHVPIVCLYKKYNKGPENDKISNAHDGFVEDFELGNIEWEEESAKRSTEIDWWKQKQKVMENIMTKEIDKEKRKKEALEVKMKNVPW